MSNRQLKEKRFDEGHGVEGLNEVRPEQEATTPTLQAVPMMDNDEEERKEVPGSCERSVFMQ